MAEDGYRLSAELRGHEEDVRGICVCPDGSIITASRDKTVKLWSPQGTDYKLTKTLRGHTSFVGPVAHISPCAGFPRGAIVSGGMDKRVLVWDPDSGEIAQELKGHESQVTCLAVTSDGTIFSGSLDKSIRTWKGASCSQVLMGHEGTVLALLALPSGDVVSGSQDATCRLWRGGACISVFRGHSDSVRGLGELPGLGFLSASHDQSIRLWATSGETLLEMWGHTALVYSVAASSAGGGEVASGSEDSTARVWKNGTPQQAIEHPGCVWDVAFLPSGDLVTACSDGVARVWTRDASRVAPPEVLEAFEAEMVAKAASKTVGGVNIGGLPGEEALDVPGKKDGQTLMVREGIKGAVYSWSAANLKWEKIGYLEDQPGAAPAKKEYLGQQYDYVFDVDIADGAPPRKLPYNNGDNPYSVADKWLTEEELPLTYREQVVDFIIKNSGGTGGGPIPQPDVILDPFTGGNAYVPGVATGGSRGGPIPVNADPFTGTGAYTPGASAPASSATRAFKHIPMRTFLAFDAAQFEGITKKLDEFNTALAADVSTQAAALTGQEAAQLQGVVTVLKSGPSSPLPSSHLPLFTKLLSWPVPNLFPTLDLLRMLVLHPGGGDQFASEGAQTALLAALQRAVAAPPPPANLLTGCRLVVNCFRHVGLKAWAAKYRSEILDMFAEGCQSSSNKNVRLAFATLVLNYAALLGSTKDQDGQLQCLSAGVELAANSGDDAESLFRALVAVGTLIQQGSLKDVARDLEVGGLVATAKASTTAKVAECARDIEKLLK